jgi:hypothetical protein
MPKGATKIRRPVVGKDQKVSGAVTTMAKQTDKDSGFLSLLVLPAWFITSIYFNYLTPSFNLYITDSLDITMVELMSASAYGFMFLPLFGLSVFPSRDLLFSMMKIGFCHLFACRLFVIAVCGSDSIPVSLAQTIRAANPVFVVFVSYFYSGKKYPTSVLLSLIPLVAGFAITTCSEVNFKLNGFVSAVGSVTMLVLLSLISKTEFLKVGSVQPHWAQVPPTTISLSLSYPHFHEGYCHSLLSPPIRCSCGVALSLP